MLVVSESFALTDTGRQRRANEDSLFHRRPLFAVADGMGGAQAGEIASGVAVSVLEKGLPDGAGSAEERLAGLVQDANAQIHDLSRADADRAGMGTTMTAVHVGETEVSVAHVGDSRLYCLRNDQLERLTRDHSLVEELVQEGRLTPEEADEHPQRSIITRALGPERSVAVDHLTWPARSGDVYLICSDGLTSMIAEAKVAELMRAAKTLEETAHALIGAANEAGGRDNITVVLFRLEEVSAGRAEDATMAGEVSAAEVRAALAAAPAPEPASRATLPPAADQAAAARRLPRQPSEGKERSRGSRRRRATFKALVIALVILTPIAAGGWIASQSVYFVGSGDDGLVTLFRGMPYELPAGLKLYSVNYSSGVPSETLPAKVRKTVSGHKLRSRDDAADLISQIEQAKLAGQTAP
jgi:protein phosphatase